MTEHERPLSFLDHPMRVGRKLKRTLYVGNGEGDAENDTVIGIVDTPQQAQEIMEAVNRYYGHEEW